MTADRAQIHVRCSQEHKRHEVEFFDGRDLEALSPWIPVDELLAAWNTRPAHHEGGTAALLLEAVEHMESMLRCTSNCGDPDAECPMQDAHKDSDMAGIVRRCRAELDRIRAAGRG